MYFTVEDGKENRIATFRNKIIALIYFYMCKNAREVFKFRETHELIECVASKKKRGIKCITWMFGVKDCRHICLFCEYYEMRRNEGSTRGEKKK